MVKFYKNVTPETDWVVRLLDNIATKLKAYRSNLLLIKRLQNCFFMK